MKRDWVVATLALGLSGLRAADLCSGPPPLVPAGAALHDAARALARGNLDFVIVGPSRRRRPRLLVREAIQQHGDERSRRALAEAAQPGPAARDLQRALGRTSLRLLRATARHAPRSYLVGGVVRDLLLGRNVEDLDLVIEGDAIEVARRLADEQGARVICRPRFGTATLRFADGRRLDLAQTRSERYEAPAALPCVAFTDLLRDLSRRDFTVNSIALPIGSRGPSRLIDPHGGVEDLQSHKLRVLHGASFLEDPTRAFRALQIGHRLGFRIDAATGRLMRVALRQQVFDRLSSARLGKAVLPLLNGADFISTARAMERYGLWSALHPKLAPGVQEYRALRRLDALLEWYGGIAGAARIERWEARLASLGTGLSEEAFHRLVRRLGRGAKSAQRIMSATREARGIRRAIRRLPTVDALRVHRICREAAVLACLTALAGTADRRTSRALRRYLSRDRLKRADLRGSDLVRAGVQPGPAIRVGLDAALEWKLAHPRAGRDAQMQAALRAAARA